MNHVRVFHYSLKRSLWCMKSLWWVQVSRIFWIQHIHCLFSSLCVVVSEFGRNMKFNRKKNHTAELRLPKLTEVVCMQLNILVWTMIDCNYNPHKNAATFYSNHLSTFKVEQINNQNTFTSTNLVVRNMQNPPKAHFSDCLSAIFPITPPSAAWGTISGQWVVSSCVTMMSAHGQGLLSANQRAAWGWSDQWEGVTCLLQCVPPDWVKLFWRPLDGEGVTLHH